MTDPIDPDTHKDDRKAKNKFGFTRARAIVAVIAAISTYIVTVVIPISPYVHKTWQHVFPGSAPTPSIQSIVSQAGNWRNIYQYSASDGSWSSNWTPYFTSPGVNAFPTVTGDEVDLRVSGGSNKGTLVFYRTRAAILPRENFIVSTQLQNEQGCSLGLVFKANMNGEYAWLNISTSRQVYINLNVVSTQYDGTVFTKKYQGQVDNITSIGIIEHDNKYIIELNGREAIGSVNVSRIGHLIGSPDLTGAYIGIGTCSCGSSARYSFSNISVGAPSST